MNDLVRILSLPAARIAVELNRAIVRRKDWVATILNEDDRVEIVHFVGGGSALFRDCAVRGVQSLHKS